MYPCCASFGFHFNILHCYEHRVCFVLLKKRADWPKAGLSGENLYVSVDENHDEIFLGTSTSRGGGLRILVGLFPRPLQLPEELGIVYGVLGRLGRAGWAGPNSQHTVNIQSTYSQHTVNIQSTYSQHDSQHAKKL